jgi:FMN phosphatase YigB (HAD superfamily)
MTPDQWWSQVIQRSLSPLLRTAGPPAADSAPTIARELIRHFATSAAYDLHADARALLLALKAQKQDPRAEFKPLVGVVSNFDPRLRGILASFGFALADARHDPARPEGQLPPPSADDDVDFVVVSYDVGAHKPDAVVFGAAADLATRLLPRDRRGEPLLKIHVGDSREHDADAAIRAGWHAVLVDRAADVDPPTHGLEYARDPPPPALHELSSLAPWNPCLLRNLADVKATTDGRLAS